MISKIEKKVGRQMGMSEVVNFLAEKWFRVEHWPLFASGSPE